MSRTIYAVSSGEYSDYAVVALFETELLAQQFIEARTSEYMKKWGRKPWYNRIEPFDYYEEDVLVFPGEVTGG